MSEQETEDCESCRFWEPPSDPDDLVGSCHRFPPRFIADIDFIQSVDETAGPRTGFFPETMPNEWCGEWAAKRSDPPVSVS